MQLTNGHALFYLGKLCLQRIQGFKVGSGQFVWGAVGLILTQVFLLNLRFTVF